MLKVDNTPSTEKTFYESLARQLCVKIADTCREFTTLHGLAEFDIVKINCEALLQNVGANIAAADQEIFKGNCDDFTELSDVCLRVLRKYIVDAHTAHDAIFHNEERELH